MRKSSLYTTYIAVIVLLPLLFTSCRQKKEEAVVTDQTKDSLYLSEAQIQLANITLAEARVGTIGQQFLLTGVLKLDEESVNSISSGIPGRIEKLYYKNTGEVIDTGVPLYEFYSEELIALQREYKALFDNNWNYVGKIDRTVSVENRLLLFGMRPWQLNALLKNRNLLQTVTVCSSRRGIIRSVNVTEGQYVEIGQQIYELADDSRIWVEAQVYPNELKYLAVGMPAEVVVPMAGDLRIPNRISFINPAFEPGSNVTLVRAIISNPGKQLHPGMHALISVETQKSKGIIIPASAVLIESRGSVIWVRNEDGSFSSRIITTGIQSADSVLVTSGLKESEQVVISGVYLLNSEKERM